MRLAATVIALALGQMGAAQAATISGVFTARATAFSPAGPPDPAVITFAISFDNTINHSKSTTGVALLTSNLPLDYPISFTYFVAGDRLSIGGLTSGPPATAAMNDFNLFTSGISTAIAFSALEVSNSSNTSGVFVSSTGTVERLGGVVLVSAPASLALLGMSLASLGLLRRRRAGS